MIYELAKQLKDAGFPRVDQLNTPQPQFFEDEAHEKPIKTPTLSELIAACETITDGNFFNLYSTVSAIRGGRILIALGNALSVNKVEGWGKTPEEAVANLWLALKENVNDKPRTNS